MMMGSWEVAEREWRKGPWTPEEDKLLVEYVNCYGEGRWSSVSKCAGLNRSGKSCRLRWVNYLRPGLKKGHITPQEEGIIIELHALWGNKWSTIARYLPGRTDNEIKNYWRTHFKKRKSDDHDHDHHGKTKTQRHNNKQEEEVKKEEKVVSDVEESYDNGVQGKKREKGNHHDQLFMQDYNNSTCFWDDLVQDDGENSMSFNGGLWEMDDRNGCSKTAIQNQAGGVANYYSRSGGGGGGGGGDAMNYMFSGDYIF